MSKFFNETQNVSSLPSASMAGVDIGEMVGAIKQTAEANGAATAPSVDGDLKHLLKPLKESQGIVTQMAAARLDKCRSIRLPRNEEKSFLVTQYNPEMQVAVEAYRQLRTRLVKQQTKSGTRSLVVSSAGPGEGKTLTTLNLALCYANIQNWPVLAIDADLRTRGLSYLLGEPQSPGLSGILDGSCDAFAAILRTDIAGFCVLPAGETNHSASELFAGLRWKELIGWATETFRLVIVDSPPALNLADLELIMAPCESAILIVRARTTSRDALTKALTQIDSRKLTGVVFNGGTHTGSTYYAYPVRRNRTEERT
jgi:capsular exopolysaccharide synthesis family protein